MLVIPDNFQGIQYSLFSKFKINFKSKIYKVENNFDITVRTEGEIATVFASDYLNKISGEKIERECRRQIEAGCKQLIVNFKDTQIVNSIGVSILLGVIDAAAEAETEVIFSEVDADTGQLFEMLGLTNHVQVISS